MIKLVALDIDGVLTDGKVTVDSDGRELKSLDYRDIDAVFFLKRSGYTLALLTAEGTDIASFFGRRLEIDETYTGVHDKKAKLEEIAAKFDLSAEEICFMGDSARDLAAIDYAGFGVCPANAVDAAKAVADYCTKQRGGDGAVADLTAQIEKRNTAEAHVVSKDSIPVRALETSEASSSCYQDSIVAHIELANRFLSDETLRQTIAKVSDHVGKVLNDGNKIILCGNGGSAADSQHIAAEFTGRFKHFRRALPAEALTTNTSSLTAIGNDFTFEEVFSRQVEALGQPGDLLWGISTSGRSLNVLSAMDVARQQGMSTLLMTGSGVNAGDAATCDYCISVPSNDTPRIQEMHILISHIICEDAERRFV